MSIITIEQLKAKFESGDWPRSTDYMDMIDTLAALPEFPLGAGTGSVTSITAGTGLTGGTITSSGTIAVDTTTIQTRVADISDTEIGYLNGVTSAIQTQIDSKSPINSPTFTGTVAGITKSMVGLSNVDNTTDAGKPVSTAQQTALDLKANLSGPTFTGTVILPSTTSIGDASATEIGYLNGVTSSIQTQLNGKAPLNAPTFTGTVTSSNNLIVDGDFTVNGTNFNASATSITIEDNMLQLAHQNAANTVDLGLVVGYNDGAAKHAGLVRDVSDSKWKLFNGVTTEPTTTVNFGQGSLDALAVGSFEATSATIGDVSNTELQYLNGVTSAIQTQMDSKLSTSTASSTYLTQTDASSTYQPIVSGVSNTEIGHLDGVTSAIQTQLNTKASTGKAIAMAIVFGG